ncbi:flavodoxin domain-containing protein [Patescibacteria group bacterium]
MKTAIIYKSFLGITKQYVSWLAKDIKADVLTFNQANDEKLSLYKTIIIASGTYAGWMPLTSFLVKKWPLIKNKKVIVASVGIAPSNDPYSKKVFEKIPLAIRKSVKIFKLPGKMFNLTPAGDIKKENLKDITSYINKINKK